MNAMEPFGTKSSTFRGAWWLFEAVEEESNCWSEIRAKILATNWMKGRQTKWTTTVSRAKIVTQRKYIVRANKVCAHSSRDKCLVDLTKHVIHRINTRVGPFLYVPLLIFYFPSCLYFCYPWALGLSRHTFCFLNGKIVPHKKNSFDLHPLRNFVFNANKYLFNSTKRILKLSIHSLAWHQSSKLFF